MVIPVGLVRNEYVSGSASASLANTEYKYPIPMAACVDGMDVIAGGPPNERTLMV